MQQPFGHDVASQAHRPVVLSHSWPDVHAVQLTPPVPHELFDSEAYGSHVSPLQQPLGHEAVSQTHCPVVVLHVLVAGHALQAAPPAPHDEFDSLDSRTHVDPSQHPWAHVFGPQDRGASSFAWSPTV